jgi:WD40 repeat protein
MLRARLVCRGLTLSAAGLLTGLSTDAASAAVPPLLAAATIRAAVLFAAGKGVGAVSAHAVALTEKAMRAMFITKLKVTAVLLLAVGVVGLGAGLTAREVLSGQKGDAEPRTTGETPAGEPEKKQAVDLHGDPLPPGVVARLGTTRFRQYGYKGVVAFSRDGKDILNVGQQSKSLCFWDPATGKMVSQCELSPPPPSQEITLSADGKLLASVGYLWQEPNGPTYGALCLWDAATGKEQRTIKLPKPSRDLCAIAITPDGKTLAFSQDDGTVRFLDVESAAEVLQDKLTRRAAQALAFSPDGSTLAVAGGRDESAFFLWEWDSGKKPRRIKIQERGVRTFAFSPDGMKLVTGSEDKEVVRLWEAESGRLLHTWKVSNSGDAYVAYSPDGKMVAAACGLHAHAVIFWDPDTGKELHRLAMGTDGASRIAFSPDSKRIAIGTVARVRVWDMAAWKEVAADEAAHRQPVSRIAFSPRDDLVVTAGEDETVRIWEAATGKQRSVLRHDAFAGGGVRYVRDLVVSPDGKRLASSALDDTVRVWDMATGKEIYKLAGHGNLGGRRALRFSPDGKRLVSWGDCESFLRVWDMATGKALLEHRIRPSGVDLPDDEDALAAVGGPLIQGPPTFSPDGKTLVVAMQDGSRVFDVETGKETLHIPNEDGYFYSLAISPDGKRLLAGASGKPQIVKNPDGTARFVSTGLTVRLWDLSSGKQLLKNVLNEGWISQVAFTPDGKNFAAITQETRPTVRLWDTNSGDETRVIEGLPARAHCFAFSPDGKKLAIGLEDTTALIYDLTREAPRPKAKAP